MKARWVVLVAAAAAIAGYAAYFFCAMSSTQAMLDQKAGEMEWLRAEYHLTDAQFDHIQALHREYAPKCDQMCQKIAQAQGRLEHLIEANKTYTPEVDEAMKECALVQGECRRALLAHVYAVSGEMAPGDGARYLQMMSGRILEPAVSHETVISSAAK